jgi:hypothetical protein
MPKPRAKPSSIHHFKNQQSSIVNLPLFHSDISFARRSQTAATAHLMRQNQELTTLRDWLLPMLMNGQVRVG